MMIIGDYVNREQRHTKQVMGGFAAVNHLSDKVIVIYKFWAQKMGCPLGVRGFLKPYKL